MPLLDAKDIQKSYPAEAGPIRVLRGASLSLEENDTLAIVGVSGVGKSTLLHVLGGLDLPDSGEILFQNENITAFSAEHLCAFRNKQLGFVFQHHFLLPEFTALENVMMPLLIRGEAASDVRKKAKNLLEELGLADRSNHIPSRLSGGEAQRTALARAVVTDPVLLLVDEPTGNLDEKTGQRVFDLLLRLKDNHSFSMLVVTHNTTIAERCRRVLRLSRGFLQERRP